jgi:putative FmdB family regulatory protein
MPTYEYLCPAGHHFETVQKMSQPPRAKCPQCGRPAARQMSGGAGLIFKGSGFYITDYGKDGKGPRKDKEAEAKPDVAPAKSEESVTASDKAKAEPAKKVDSAPPTPSGDTSDKADKSPRKKSKS